MSTPSLRLTKMDYAYLYRHPATIVPQEIAFLEVPVLLAHHPMSVSTYVEMVNTLEICDVNGQNLIPNHEKTVSERQKLLSRSPCIMNGVDIGTVVVRTITGVNSNHPCLGYQSGVNGIVAVTSDLDYVYTLETAARYLGSTSTEVSNIVKNGRLPVYTDEKGSLTLAKFKPARPSFYLLTDLNRLKNS